MNTLENLISTGSVILDGGETVQFIRKRNINATVRMTYKGKDVKDIGSWRSIRGAIDQAEQFASRFEIDSGSEAEIVVFLEILDQSLVLDDTDNYRHRSSGGGHNHPMAHALICSPGHGPDLVFNGFVWSTKSDFSGNLKSAHSLLNNIGQQKTA